MSHLLLVLISAWPEADAKLTVLPVPPLLRRVRVAVDAGHGAPGNTGNSGCHCQREADETLAEATQLAARLRRFGFEVLETRTTIEGTPYKRRIAAIERFRPDLVVSLHTDSRGEASASAFVDGGVCWANPSDPGFAVLWSDEGPAPAITRRQFWGRTVSEELARAGFGIYSGDDYGSLYNTDTTPGCFIDARPLTKRVYFLRATTAAPVIIIETHHALDPIEVARWQEPSTHEAFAAAIASAAVRVVEER